MQVSPLYPTSAPEMVANVTRIVVPDEYNVLGKFPLAVLNQSKNTRESQSFIDLVMSKEGQAILKKYGYIPVDQL